MTASELPACFLFDNGSLRAESTLSLRRVAASLARRLGRPVEAVSLLHSSGVPTERLDGVPARLLEPALNAWLESHASERAIVVPLFFGPSAALTVYVPERFAALREKHPAAQLTLARPLMDLAGPPDLRVAEALVGRVREVMVREGLKQPAVIVVDHGSPQPAVTDVRNHLGAAVRALLGRDVCGVAVASMERREGEAYAFNEPLLSRCLRQAGFDCGDVIVALQFVSPGRHAGPGGDIAEICAAAEREQPRLKTYLTETLGDDPRIVEILAERYLEAAAIARGGR